MSPVKDTPALPPPPSSQRATADEDAENIYWRNRSNGNPRARPVLNNDGDGIKLLDPAGGVITMSYTSGRCVHAGAASAASLRRPCAATSDQETLPPAVT